MKRLLTAFGVPMSITALAETAAKSSRPQLHVEIGVPTFVHHLKYQKMYSEKPFEEATLFYYDNGIHKIILQAKSTMECM